MSFWLLLLSFFIDEPLVLPLLAFALIGVLCTGYAALWVIFWLIYHVHIS